jgi:hypothetical protein
MLVGNEDGKKIILKVICKETIMKDFEMKFI